MHWLEAIATSMAALLVQEGPQGIRPPPRAFGHDDILRCILPTIKRCSKPAAINNALGINKFENLIQERAQTIAIIEPGDQEAHAF